MRHPTACIALLIFIASLAMQANGLEGCDGPVQPTGLGPLSGLSLVSSKTTANGLVSIRLTGPWVSERYVPELMPVPFADLTM